MTEPNDFDPTRRSMIPGAAAGAAMLAFAGAAAAAEGDKSTFLNARGFGAKGDGKTDDTKALQTAIDHAGEVSGSVFLPPGNYPTGELKLRRNVAIMGVAAWDYRKGGGSVLTLIDPKAKSLLNITGAPGVTLNNLSLEGGRLGEEIHGIFLDKPDYGKEEDTFRIDGCQVARFTGTGVNLQRVWCFSIRHSMIAYNGADGVRCLGWDGFITDNWFSGNRGAGWNGTSSASVTATGNRVEWNRAGGFLLAAASHYNITGNYIDRSGNSGIAVLDNAGRPSRHISITGNVIYRSGKFAELDTHGSSQARIENAKGITYIGNTMVVGRDDRGQGKWSPSYGIVCKALENCVVKDNVLHDGALKQLVLDLGSHGEGYILKDNPGQLFNIPDKS